MKHFWSVLILALAAGLLMLASPVAAAPTAAAANCNDSHAVIGESYSLPTGQQLDSNLVVLGAQASVASGASVNCNVVVMGGNLSLGGKVVVQSFDPQLPAIVRAAGHDYFGYAEEELSQRLELGYPPFARLVSFIVRDPDRDLPRAVPGLAGLQTVLAVVLALVLLMARPVDASAPLVGISSGLGLKVLATGMRDLVGLAVAALLVVCVQSALATFARHVRRMAELGLLPTRAAHARSDGVPGAASTAG